MNTYKVRVSATAEVTIDVTANDVVGAEVLVREHIHLLFRDGMAQMIGANGGAMAVKVLGIEETGTLTPAEGVALDPDSEVTL